MKLSNARGLRARSSRVVLGVLGAAAALTTSGEALAVRQPDRVPGVLFGGRVGPPPPKPPVEWSPNLPTGTPRIEPARPSGIARQCSSRRPVCVHAAPDDPLLGPALAALEQAWDRVLLVQQLPTPLSDGVLGGDSRLDWYLTPQLGPQAAQAKEAVLGVLPDEQDVEPRDFAPVFEVFADAPLHGVFDRASGYCQSHGAWVGALERQAALCVAELSLMRLDAGEGAFTRRAIATQLWWTLGAPTDMDVEAIDDFQRHPERALGGGALRRHAEGVGLFYEYLDEVYGVSRWGVLPTQMYSLAASLTEGEGWLYQNEPDVFDVLRHTFEEDASAVADVLGSFTLARSLLGDRSDGSHFARLGWVGSFGRVRFDWAFRYSELPRHVGAWRPIEPTGAAFVFLALDELPKLPELGLRALWEEPVSFKWGAMLLDAEGRFKHHVQVAFQPRVTRSERTLPLDVRPGESLVIYGVSSGGVSELHPFDPDVTPFEPHEYALYLVDVE
ncbi:MAG: hypothetical protein KIT72_05190 [Polyangiaceae bacterium]|nr:hypothetical protein [Polyangiaceae bacterium]MCW5789799.1 hypothetical protein [Polyangiaceae bacterium]